MNKDGFRSFLKKQRRSGGTINQCVLFTSNFEDNLTEHRHSKGIDFDMRNLKPEDLDEIIEALKYDSKKGFYIEPTAAATIAGLEKYLIRSQPDEQIISAFTGHGLKATEKILKIIEIRK